MKVEGKPAPGRMIPESYIELVAERYRLPHLQRRSHRHAEARAACAWAALETGICTLTDVARMLKRDISTLSAGARRMGECQDAVQGLEDLLEFVLNYKKAKT